MASRKQIERMLERKNKRDGLVMRLTHEKGYSNAFVWCVRNAEDETVGRMIVGNTLKEVYEWLRADLRKR